MCIRDRQYIVDKISFRSYLCPKNTMSEELKQLITWFENYQVTFNEIRLSECENIFDLRKYIDVHVRSVKRNWDNPTFASDILLSLIHI